MIFVIGLLTVALVLDCVLLILLVLIQLPKKEAGAALAFGGAATDALFGAGSGNVLTKTTKYATIAFFVLLLAIGMVQGMVFKPSSKKFKESVDQAAKEPVPSQSASAPAVVPSGSNAVSASLQSLALTNAVSSPATSAPAAK